MKCPHCGETMARQPDETHKEFVERWEAADCPGRWGDQEQPANE